VPSGRAANGSVGSRAEAEAGHTEKDREAVEVEDEVVEMEREDLDMARPLRRSIEM
jgi:hypothetical protein